MLVEKKVVIKNKLGLHARPAAMFVQIANKFDCDILVRRGNQKANGKSIMGILTLAANRGSKILLRAEGPDSQAAVTELEKLLSGQLDDVLFKEVIPKTKKDVSRKGGLIPVDDKEEKNG
jgi:phosphotransferase system HPr (HPr) family protein